MRTKQAPPKNIDEYIAGFPKGVQEKLQKIRATIQKAAPEAKEAIKYLIPTFTLNRNLVHFAAFRNHIGLYPVPRAEEEFKDALSKYEGGKGTAQFPLDKPIPLNLITRIVKFRVKQDKELAAARKKKP